MNQQETNSKGGEASRVLQVAVPVPVRRTFDYQSKAALCPGTRVLVPFGSRRLTGIVISANPSSYCGSLLDITRQLDDIPAIPSTLFDLLAWSARYYHHPVGEVFHAALPAVLRASRTLFDPTVERHYRACTDFCEQKVLSSLARAPKQKHLFTLLKGQGWVAASAVPSSFSSDTIRRLLDRHLIETSQKPIEAPPEKPVSTPSIELTAEQTQACTRIGKDLSRYTPYLLQGITGSGKTEVYLDIAEQVLNLGKQILVLVPEIALTAQLIKRFTARFGQRVGVIHSGLPPAKRYGVWWNARAGQIAIVLGTRSAVFTPLKNPGLIIVDEEHDLSFKQQDTFRYHARDVAVKRASIEDIPIVLGSATPSMESSFNARNGRYQQLNLTHRAGISSLPIVHTIDTKRTPVQNGISHSLISEIKKQLDRQQQTILYLNRRGFSPVVQCSRCGWQALCHRCDARLVYHRTTQQFRCHHCQGTKNKYDHCQQCGCKLFFAGIGTQRIEKMLSEQFPDARISRIDRDELTTEKKLASELEKIADRKVDIIIGTQLITKGHDFPFVTLVGVIDSDQYLYSADFRSSESLFQQLVQVSGRAGRSTLPGRVFIQTAYPDNQYFKFIQSQNYPHFSDHCLNERQAARFPPFCHIALWRAETPKQYAALRFLESVKKIGENAKDKWHCHDLHIMDPVPSPMEKLEGRYRSQLLVKSPNRNTLHRLLKIWLIEVESSNLAKTARWSIDIDPMEMY